MKKTIGYILMIVGVALIGLTFWEMLAAATTHRIEILDAPDPTLWELPKIFVGAITVGIGYLLKR